METKGTRGIRGICVHFAGHPREWRAISISQGKGVIRAWAAVSERPQFNFYFQSDVCYIHRSSDTSGCIRNKVHYTFDICIAGAVPVVSYFIRKVRTKWHIYRGFRANFGVENICFRDILQMAGPREIPVDWPDIDEREKRGWKRAPSPSERKRRVVNAAKVGVNGRDRGRGGRGRISWSRAMRAGEWNFYSLSCNERDGKEQYLSCSAPETIFFRARNFNDGQRIDDSAGDLLKSR